MRGVSGRAPGRRQPVQGAQATFVASELTMQVAAPTHSQASRTGRRRAAARERRAKGRNKKRIKYSEDAAGRARDGEVRLLVKFSTAKAEVVLLALRPKEEKRRTFFFFFNFFFFLELNSILISIYLSVPFLYYYFYRRGGIGVEETACRLTRADQRWSRACQDGQRKATDRRQAAAEAADESIQRAGSACWLVDSQTRVTQIKG